MYKKLLFKLSGAVVLVLFVSSMAQANNYWALGAGNSSFDIKPFFGLTEVEDSTAIRLLFGSRQQNTGMELDVSIADYEWVGSSDSHTVANVVFAGIGYIPMSDSVELFAKGGFNFWSTTVDFSGSLYDGDTSIGLSIGGGLNFALSRDFNLRAEYQFLNGIGDGVDEGDISQLMFTGVFRY